MLRGDIVKDDSGSYAVFTGQGSSASQMTAAKVMDVTARLPDCDGQAADAVSACTQVKLEDAPRLLRIPKLECPDMGIRHQRQKWPTSWSDIEDPVFPLERNLYGHPLAGLLWERQFEEVLLELGCEKVPNWECLFFHREGLFFSVYVVDVKMAGKKQNMAPMWKKLMKHADLDDNFIFVSILSHTRTRLSRLRPRTRTRPSHYNTIQPNTTRGWLFASGSSWTLRHTGGSRQDTHGTPVPEREGRGWPTTCSTRRPPKNDNRRRQAMRQTCFQKTSAVIRETQQQPGADRRLESGMAAEHSSLKLPFLETTDPRRSRRASWTKTPSTMSKRSPRSSSRSRRETKPITPEKINRETEHIKPNGTEYSKIPQNPYTDRVVDVFVAGSSESAYARKESEKETR